MAPKARFTEGEKVLCFHGPLLYEAKCLRAQIRDKHMKYFIHYSGWNKNWDEWVTECRVLKYNEVNLQKQKELAKNHIKSKKSKSVKMVVKKETENESTPPPAVEKTLKQKPEKKPVPTPPVESPPEPVEPKKPKVKSEPEFAEEPEVVQEIRIPIPPVLNSWLVDDWDLINRKNMIMHLPARITVDHIIANYVKEKVSVKDLSPFTEATVVYITNQIRDCFNILLGKRALYKFERPQYGEMLAEYRECRLSQIYGAPHLLRMITTLGPLLTGTVTPGMSLEPLLKHINDFVNFIAKNPHFFSLDDYVVASPEYQRRAIG